MTDKRILIYVFGGLVLFTLTVFLLIPKTKEVWQSREELINTQKRLESLKAKVRDLEGLDENELTRRTKLTLQAVPMEKTYVEILAIVNELAREKGLVVVGFRVTPGTLVVSQKGTLAFGVQLSGGDLEVVKDYLTELKKMLPLITPVEELDIKLKDFKKEVSTAAKTSFTIEGVFQPLPKTIGAVDQPLVKMSEEEEKYLKSLSEYKTLKQEAIPTPEGKENPFIF